MSHEQLTTTEFGAVAGKLRQKFGKSVAFYQSWGSSDVCVVSMMVISLTQHFYIYYFNFVLDSFSKYPNLISITLKRDLSRGHG